MIDRRAFARDGLVLVPGVVGRDRVDAAMRAINHWIVGGFDPAQLAVYGSRSYAPELTEASEIVGLCTETSVLELAESLVGRSLLRPSSGQIALRFPTASDAAIDGHAIGGHIDGLPSPNNGVERDGRVHAFTVLAGIFLRDVPQGCHGNFTVWPGTHHAMATWFRDNGTRIDEPDVVYAENARLSATPGMSLGARAGDVVFAHHLLVHTVAPHTGPDIRYAVFFRLRVRPWGEYDDAVLTDPWHEYVAMPRS